METFIELVKTRSFLYDNDHTDFRNREKRAEAWNEIAEKMATETGNYWRFKWNCLKENYCKFKKVTEDPSNRTYKKYRNWPWAENMKFIDDFPTRRMSKRNILNASQTKKDIIDDKNSVTDELLDSKYALPNTANTTCMVKPRVTDELSEYVDISKIEDDLIQNEVIYFPMEVDLEDPVEDIQVIIQGDVDEDNGKGKRGKLKSVFSENLPANLELRKNKKRDYDEVEHFFMSYAKTFKRLPGKLQRVLKLEMVTLFARYELQAETMGEDAGERDTKRM